MRVQPFAPPFLKAEAPPLHDTHLAVACRFGGSSPVEGRPCRIRAGCLGCSRFSLFLKRPQHLLWGPNELGHHQIALGWQIQWEC
ncbi:g4996 [Coccomyxa elongata]